MIHSKRFEPQNIQYLEKTHSTNSYLSTLCNKESIAEWTTVRTGYQTAGRGQRGNTWESDKDLNLLFSFVLYPEFIAIKQQFLLSQIVSLAICEELQQYAEGFSIKWPNDIYWKNKKIAGILIENDLCGTKLSKSIIGIGLNVNQEKFLSDAPNPVSLYQIIQMTQDTASLCTRIMQRIEKLYVALRNQNYKDIKKYYIDNLFRKDGFYTYEDENGFFEARITLVEDNGKLHLTDTKGVERSYYFKEVSFIL